MDDRFFSFDFLMRQWVWEKTGHRGPFWEDTVYWHLIGSINADLADENNQ